MTGQTTAIFMAGLASVVLFYAGFSAKSRMARIVLGAAFAVSAFVWTLLLRQ